MAIAMRLREIVQGTDPQQLAAVAERLRVQEISLRMSIDPDSPHPTIEVLAAIIREYAVDPSWLLTGEYDPDTHRQAIEGDPIAARPLREFVSQRPTRIAEPTPESVRSVDLN